ncbi:hypothetical protein GCM10023192_09010 [Amycolatopsis samaneae]
MRPNVAFAALDAPNVAFGAWNGGWTRSVSVEGGGGGKERSTQCHIGALVREGDPGAGNTTKGGERHH